MPSAAPRAERILAPRQRARAWGGASWLAGALALGCGAPESPAAAPTAGATNAPEASAQQDSAQNRMGPETTSIREKRAQLAIDETLQRVARVRELSALGSVKGELLTPKALVSHVEKSLDKEVPPEALHGNSEVLWALGTVPDGFDYRGSMLAMMGDELAGLYDPEAKTMFLRDDLGTEAQDATLQHELVHALQDQHFKLDRMTDWRDDATDELSAFSALAEGDATSAMFDGMLAESGRTALDLPSSQIDDAMRMMSGISEDAERVPTILKRSLLSPYVDGLSFVHTLRRNGGWQAVNAAWQSVPTTTEQVLHPEKYAAREPALAVEIPGAPPAQGGKTPANWGTFSLFFHDVWGEQSTRLLFEEWMPLRTAAESASGWGGDRLAVYHAGDVGAVAWHVLADDDASAERMLRAFARGTLSKTWSADALVAPRPSDAEARAAISGDKACRERESRGPLLVKRRGRELVVVAGPYERSAAAHKIAGCGDAERWADLVLTTPRP